ncbi:ABC transporter ATP-binding protein [Rheinheimera baltica]|uniref:ABC transporter ATP-binding protein n=1 Tax=Rheinheimera baltica TaxID=67576 RepID=A0ABT9I312_9GAMM|nr:ABC transporter ATP-binding protein [Rheinheimera baltica]MDP5137771.1 ABC transporter ATP-binding protein [Rheinheimera baltica]MDP5144054.1 ABC transporter ATP-binding protein [Rheinheimera baltica]MDP5148864.1 ABC transporter ATP-binding protein [Rheinheimera baltica]MDP5190154.1 ABC transporter ATP-binding protein [Rheinheimera baltica]
MLSINNLCVTYADGTQALRDINLQLPTGMVGLLGPNGAGKSTLMRTLACLQTPDKGQIHFGDIDTLKQPMALRSQLGYLPQYFGVYPHMSCYAMLLHMAILKGINDKAQQQQQIETLLELTNLSSVANKNVATFSGGMRQRFGIAQALLGDPHLLIMDEPTAGLDPAERERLHALLVNISKDKLILLSTHIVEDIENLCPFVALINTGRIVESGKVQSLIAPLQGRIWQSPVRPADSSTVLSESYRFGLPVYRLLSELQPCDEAIPVVASLQDRYFFELSHKANANDVL